MDVYQEIILIQLYEAQKGTDLEEPEETVGPFWKGLLFLFILTHFRWELVGHDLSTRQ